MQVQEPTLPALVKHKELSAHLHLLVCEICGIKAEFNPDDPVDFEHARYQIMHHRCKGQ